MKNFEIIANVSGLDYVEDPHCPSEWRGSGCYDIPVHGHQHITIDVFARTEDEARKLAEDFCYGNGEFQEIEAVDLVEVDFLSEDPEDDTQAEIASFCYGPIWWYGDDGFDEEAAKERYYRNKYGK